MSEHEPLLVPIGGILGHLDNDSPGYVFSPDTYLTLALAYDALAAPAAIRDADGVVQAQLDAMQPRMALSWDEQPDGDWLIRLRPGMRSHAGHEFTAEDLAWTFEKSFAVGVMASWRWQGVVGVEKVEPVSSHTARFSLRTPYPTFPNWLVSVSPNMVDAAEIRDHLRPDDPWGVAWLDEHVAGYGAYALEEMTSARLLFRSRPDYWGTAPAAERVEVALAADRKEAIAQLGQRRPVAIVGADPDETAVLLRAGDLTIVRVWGGHVSIEIDFTTPPFDDQRVRQALALGTPSAEIRSAGLLGMARPWRSPAKGASQWYIEAAADDYDPEQARQLLKEAGLGDGIIADLYIENMPYCARIADIIVTAWHEIGIDLTVRDIDSMPAGWLPPLSLRTECGHNLTDTVYDIAHDYAAMNPLLPLPGGPPNVGNWRPRWKKNPEALRRFAEVLAAGDGEQKRARTEDLQRYLAGFGSSIYIAEMQQVLVANELAPPGLLADDSRFLHALGYQNARTNYLPAH